jgi:ATP-binding cassette, subfamily C, bacterial LapB
MVQSRDRTATKPAAPPLTPDHLLDCLGWIVRFHGGGFAPAAALSGLPLAADHRLTADLLPRAAKNCGLQAELVALQPSAVPALVAPFIALMANDQPCVVVRLDKRSRTASVVYPGSDGERRITLADLDLAATGTVIYLTPAAQIADTVAAPATPANPSRWLWGPVLRLWPAWTNVLIAACVINLLGLAVPIFVMQIYDRVLPNQTLPTLWALTAGVVIAVIFDFVLRQLRASMLDQAGWLVDVNVASHLFQRVMRISLAARQQSVGTLANQIREFETVRDFFTSSSVIALTDLLFIGLIIAVMWMIAGPLAWAVIIAVPLVIATTLLSLIPLGRSVRATLGHASRRHSILVESLSSIETLKALNAEGVMQRRWEAAVSATARANTSTRTWSSVALHMSLLVQQAIGILVLVWGVYLVNDGIISVGALIAASMLSGRALAPLSNIAMTITRAQQAFTALRSINALMALPVEQADGRMKVERITTSSVELRNVSFSYTDQATPALSNVSIKMAPGERIGIVGRVGSGKSTLGRLIARLYAASSGTLLVGGLDVLSVDPAEVRAAVGYVQQDVELFEGTLRENITLGHQSASEADIAQAIQIAGLEPFVAAHPLGLGLPLRERGQGLSGGQRQAVGLARTLLRQPKILFLDEPSSAMDIGTESELVRRLATWCTDARVLIVSTHRLQLLELCDRVIIIDNGQITADGPKAQVLASLRGAPVSVTPTSPPTVARSA